MISSLSSIFHLSSHRRHSASTMTLRSIEWNSGLFDKGFPGDLSSAENIKVEGDLDTINTDDLLSVLDPTFADDTAVLVGERHRRLTGSSVSSMIAGSTSTYVDENIVDEPSDSDFLEVFTNIDDLLPPGDTNIDTSWLLGLPIEESCDSNILEVSKPLKRTADEAFTPTTVPPPNPDHNDYVCKIKVPRKSLASECSDADSVASTSTKKTEKYVERRKKNNIASRRSRETRKQKFVIMEEQAVNLELANEKLRSQVTELEHLTKTMKNILIEKLAQSK